MVVERRQTKRTPGRRELTSACWMAVRLNLYEGICNHFLLMLPGRHVLINPKGLRLSA